MAVYRNLRKNVASKISSIENTETFLWDKWLRSPSSEELEIKPLKSKLDTTDEIVLNIDKPSNESIDPKIPKVKSKKASSKIFSIKTKSNPVFFGFGIPSSYNIDIKFYKEFKQYFSTVVHEEDYSIFFLVENTRNEKNKKQLNPKTKNIPFNFTYLKDKYENKEPKGTKINFLFKETETKNIVKDIPVRSINNIEYQIAIPEVIDHLSRFIPKVYEIALLNTFEGLNLNAKDFHVKIDILDEAPYISSPDISQLNKTSIITPSFTNEIKSKTDKNNYAKNIKFGSTSIKKASKREFTFASDISLSLKYDYDVSQRPVQESKLSNLNLDIINRYLQPEVNLSEEEIEEIFKYLYPYQKEGAEFLTENQRANLIDEVSLGKTVQAITAMKYLIRKREIKTAIVITLDYSTGDKEFNNKTNSFDGWEGQLQKFAGNISSVVLNSNTNEIIKGLKQPAQIFILPYSVIFKDTFNEILKTPKFKNIDCICLDDAELFYSYYNKLEKIIKTSGAKFIWLLSNTPNETFQQKIAIDYNFKAVLSRSKKQINSQLPVLTRQDFWCDLNKKQLTEYEQSLFQAKSQIDDVLATGNPYRLQAKVFTLLHQLKQLTNFSTDEISNNKTRLLLLHLESIIKFGGRAVIFSQYDKYGTKKLTELFKQKNIPFISYSPSLALKEMEESYKKLGNDKSIKVFLIKTQADIKNIKFENIDYIIHFDQWWIPSKQWQLEERILNNNSGSKTVHVISYLTKNTIDEKLHEKLYEKKLLEKNLIDPLGTVNFSKLFSENDWLDIFNFPENKKYNEIPLSVYTGKIQGMKPEELAEKLNYLFSSIGYKNVEMSKDEKQKEYVFNGEYDKDKQTIEFTAHFFPTIREIDDKIKAEIIKAAEDNLDKKKYFIITLNKTDIKNDFYPTNLTFLNLDFISIYFQMLRII